MTHRLSQRLRRLEDNRRILRRGAGVLYLEAGESLEARLATLPALPDRYGYLVIDEPTEEDYRLARGVAT